MKILIKWRSCHTIRWRRIPNPVTRYDWKTGFSYEWIDKTQFNQKPHDWYTLENELSFSAGIIKKKDSESFSTGIDRADKKLYQAKSEGRNKVIM